MQLPSWIEKESRIIKSTQFRAVPGSSDLTMLLIVCGVQPSNGNAGGSSYRLCIGVDARDISGLSITRIWAYCNAFLSQPGGLLADSMKSFRVWPDADELAVVTRATCVFKPTFSGSSAMQNAGMRAWSWWPKLGLQHVSQVLVVVGLFRNETTIWLFATWLLWMRSSRKTPPHAAASLQRRWMLVELYRIASRLRWAPRNSERTEKKWASLRLTRRQVQPSFRVWASRMTKAASVNLVWEDITSRSWRSAYPMNGKSMISTGVVDGWGVKESSTRWLTTHSLWRAPSTPATACWRNELSTYKAISGVDAIHSALNLLTSALNSATKNTGIRVRGRREAGHILRGRP